MDVFSINKHVSRDSNDKYAIYLRKSRADLEAEKFGEGETLARHRGILTTLAARHGFYVEKIYEEIVSGETIEARPRMQELIDDCYAGKYRGIIIIEVTRLSRGNQGDAQKILDCLKYGNNNNGVLVITPTKTYDVANNYDDMEYMEFELFMSRREYKMIQKRMDRGRKQAVVEGNFMGSYRPYGYDIKKTKTGRTLVPNPEESRIVQLMYAWAANDNMTAGAIARKLDAMGIPTYTGAPEWNTSTVKTILTNPTYIGKVRWNDRMRVKSLVNGELVHSRPRSNHTSQYMEYEGKHEALIDEETFQNVGKRYTSDKTKANLTLKNPLAGVLVCANCKKAMVYQGYTKKKNVEPRIVHPPSKVCKVKSATLRDVLDAFVYGLKLNIEDLQLKIDNSPLIDEKSIETQITALQSELKKTQRKMDKLFDAWENELISDNDFVQRKQVNAEKIESIKSQIEKIEDTIPEREEYEEKIYMLHDALEYLRDNEIDADIKNEFIKKIVERVEFSRENNEEFVLDIFLR